MAKEAKGDIIISAKKDCKHCKGVGATGVNPGNHRPILCDCIDYHVNKSRIDTKQRVILGSG